MDADSITKLLDRIGGILADDPEYPPNGTLLYAEVDQGSVGPSIFKDRGNMILYRWPDLDALADALSDLWYATAGPARWTAIEYLVTPAGRLNVSYSYDAIDLEEDMLERRDAVVRRYFGDKPIVYPPWPPPGTGGPDYDL